MFQGLTKEALSGSTVSPLRYENIDDIPILIHRPPQVVAFASHGNKHCIDMPDGPVSAVEIEPSSAQT
jgi:hypothetical protein